MILQEKDAEGTGDMDTVEKIGVRWDDNIRNREVMQGLVREEGCSGAYEKGRWMAGALDVSKTLAEGGNGDWREEERKGMCRILYSVKTGEEYEDAKKLAQKPPEKGRIQLINCRNSYYRSNAVKRYVNFVGKATK